MSYRYAAAGGSGSSGFAGNFDTIIDPPPAAAAAPDDEFAVAGLDPKWTAVAGSVLAPDPNLAGVNAGSYQVPGNGLLHVQASGPAPANEVALRQDYTLPENRCVIAKLLYGQNPDVYSFNAAHNIAAFTINNSDVSHSSGDRITLQCSMTQDNPTFRSGGLGRIEKQGFGGAVTIPAASDAVPGEHVYFRFIRGTGNRYISQVSFSGLGWVTMSDDTTPTPLDNIWIRHNFVIDCTVSFVTSRIPIHSWDWVREGTIDPFPQFGP